MKVNMGKLEFLKLSLKNIRTTGTITRSSQVLCKNMVKHVDYKSAKVLVELGAGDGVITQHILRKMQKDATLLCFEVNPAFCELLNEINDSRLVVIQDSAENLEKYLLEHGFNEIDSVISAIPFVSLPDALGLSIIGECERFLKKGGLFVQVHYSLLAKKFYQKVFGNVDINFVPLNIPPAFVLVSKKQ